MSLWFRNAYRSTAPSPAVFTAVGWEWQFTPFTPILLLAGGVMASIGAYAWRHREVTGATSFAVLMATATLWAVAYALQLAGANAATIGFWADLNHVGVAGVPVAWLCFTLQFTGRDAWLTRRTLLALSVVPAIYLLLLATNDAHHLVRGPIELETVGTMVVSEHAFGPAFWLHAAYGYALMAAGTVLLAHLLFWSPAVYRRQVGLLIVGVAVAAGANASYHLGVSPVGHLDPTPFSFAVSGALFFLAIYHYRLFDLRPVARALVVDTLREGVVVLDTADRVVDANDAARRLLGVDEAIGRPVDSLFPSDVDGSSVPTDGRSTDGGRDAFATDGSTGGGATSRADGIAETVAPIDGDGSAVDSIDGGGSAVLPVDGGGSAVLPVDGADDPVDREDGPTDGTDGSVGDGEIVLETDAGRRILHLSVTPVVDVRGDRLGRSIVVRDVTETRRLRAELEDTLERLRRSNEELESFAAVVSHDLREPLRTTERQLALFEADGDEALVAAARENAERAQEMIADLLAYSRIGRDGEEFGPVDCDRLLTDVLAALRFEIEDRDATVEVGELPTVAGVDHQLRRLFQNLLSNALEYAGEEPPEIEVTATAAEDGWAFSVRDAGVGIEPAYVDRAFELFDRAGRTDPDGGTGMGLSICRRIVSAHGGEIDIDSTPGEGTTVRFTLPDVDDGPPRERSRPAADR